MSRVEVNEVSKPARAKTFDSNYPKKLSMYVTLTFIIGWRKEISNDESVLGKTATQE